MNPDAEFIFCAGDDKTDEEMFYALLLFPPGVERVTLQAPVAVTHIDDPDTKPVDLAIRSEAVFTTAVGHSSKRTLARWHVTTPQEIVEHMLELVKDVPYTPSPRNPGTPRTAEAPHEEEVKEKANP